MPSITLPERFWRIHEPAAPPAERLDERLQRQALLLAQREPLAERGVGARDEHLVDGLAGLARARAAEVRDRLQNASSAGRAVATCASSPPTKAVSWPLRAPSEPPETGASTAPAPRSARARARRGAPCPARSSSSRAPRPRCSMPSATPSGPSTTASTSGESATQRHTSSAPCAASRGVSARLAPRSASACSRSRVRLWTVSSCPASSRCPAMNSPMVPSPIHAIFMGGRLDGRRRRRAWR